MDKKSLNVFIALFMFFGVVFWITTSIHYSQKSRSITDSTHKEDHFDLIIENNKVDSDTYVLPVEPDFQNNDLDVDENKTTQNTSVIRVHLYPFQKSVPVNVKLLDENNVVYNSYHAIASASTVELLVNDYIFSGTIVASASNYIPTLVSLHEDSMRKEIEISLYDKINVNLKIESDWSKNVPNAIVNISSHEKGIYTESYETDLSGLLNLQLPHSGQYRLHAYHSNYNSSKQIDINFTHNPNNYTIHLDSQSGTIMGVVYTDHNTPISGVKVYLSYIESNAIVTQGITNEEGHFNFFDIRFGKYNIGIDPSDEYIKRDIEYQENGKHNTLLKKVELDANNIFQQVDFHTSKAIVIEGIVLDEFDAPIADTLIKLAIKGGNIRASLYPTKIETTSNKNGVFKLPLTTRIKSRDALLIAGIHPDYEYKTKSVTDFDWENTPNPITLVLSQPSSKLKGRIIDSL